MIGLIFSVSLAALAAAALPTGLPLTIQAAPDAAYAVKCHVRTYKDPDGGLANTYTLVRKGPFQDAIPSPNAQCQLWKTGGPGPVILHIAKAGDHAATATDVGKPVSLQVW
jgi:hypothetical protein